MGDGYSSTRGPVIKDRGLAKHVKSTPVDKFKIWLRGPEYRIRRFSGDLVKAKRGFAIRTPGGRIIYLIRGQTTVGYDSPKTGRLILLDYI